MIDNSKEYILCAAYKQTKNTSNRQKYIDEGKDPKTIYYTPHNEIYDLRLGWRHPDILYQYGDQIDKHSDGFVTSRGRWVNREEAYKIAIECGQIEKGKYSENVYIVRIYTNERFKYVGKTQGLS